MRGARESEREYILELHTEIRVHVHEHARVDCDGVPERYIGKSIGKNAKAYTFPVLAEA